MKRRLSRSLPALALIAVVGGRISAGGPAAPNAPAPPVLERFLALDDPVPVQVHALRRFEAWNDKFRMRASMTVWTDIDGSGFRYRIVDEEGSDWIRARVFREVLEAERRAWASGAVTGAGFTPANYTFEDRGELNGLASVSVTPRRKDMLLIEGAIFLRPGDGELMRMEGDLARPPSFWTRHVRVTRRLARFAGVRMPVALEAVANVRFVGPSTFRAAYEYETVNSARVGTPQLRAASH